MSGQRKKEIIKSALILRDKKYACDEWNYRK